MSSIRSSIESFIDHSKNWTQKEIPLFSDEEGIKDNLFLNSSSETAEKQSKYRNILKNREVAQQGLDLKSGCLKENSPEEKEFIDFFNIKFDHFIKTETANYSPADFGNPLYRCAILTFFEQQGVPVLSLHRQKQLLSHFLVDQKESSQEMRQILGGWIRKYPTFENRQSLYFEQLGDQSRSNKKTEDALRFYQIASSFDSGRPLLQLKNIYAVWISEKTALTKPDEILKSNDRFLSKFSEILKNRTEEIKSLIRVSGSITQINEETDQKITELFSVLETIDLNSIGSCSGSSSKVQEAIDQLIQFYGVAKQIEQKKDPNPDLLIFHSDEETKAEELWEKRQKDIQTKIENFKNQFVQTEEKERNEIAASLFDQKEQSPIFPESDSKIRRLVFLDRKLGNLSKLQEDLLHLSEKLSEIKDRHTYFSIGLFLFREMVLVRSDLAKDGKETELKNLQESICEIRNKISSMVPIELKSNKEEILKFLDQVIRSDPPDFETLENLNAGFLKNHFEQSNAIDEALSKIDSGKIATEEKRLVLIEALSNHPKPIFPSETEKLEGWIFELKTGLEQLPLKSQLQLYSTIFKSLDSLKEKSRITSDLLFDLTIRARQVLYHLQDKWTFELLQSHGIDAETIESVRAFLIVSHDRIGLELLNSVRSGIEDYQEKLLSQANSLSIKDPSQSLHLFTETVRLTQLLIETGGGKEKELANTFREKLVPHLTAWKMQADHVSHLSAIRGTATEESQKERQFFLEESKKVLKLLGSYQFLTEKTGEAKLEKSELIEFTKSIESNLQKEADLKIERGVESSLSQIWEENPIRNKAIQKELKNQILEDLKKNYTEQLSKSSGNFPSEQGIKNWIEKALPVYSVLLVSKLSDETNPEVKLQQSFLAFGGFVQLGLKNRAAEAIQPLLEKMKELPVSAHLNFLQKVVETYQTAGWTKEANEILQNLINEANGSNSFELRGAAQIAQVMQKLNDGDLESAEKILIKLPQTEETQNLLSKLKSGGKSYRISRTVSILRSISTNLIEHLKKNKTVGITQIEKETAAGWEEINRLLLSKECETIKDALQKLEKSGRFPHFLLGTPSTLEEGKVLHRFFYNPADESERAIFDFICASEDPTIGEKKFAELALSFARHSLEGSIGGISYTEAAGQAYQLFLDHPQVKDQAKELFEEAASRGFIRGTLEMAKFIPSLIMQSKGNPLAAVGLFAAGSFLSGIDPLQESVEYLKFMGPFAIARKVGITAELAMLNRFGGVSSTLAPSLLRGIGWGARSTTEAFALTAGNQTLAVIESGSIDHLTAGGFMKEWGASMVMFGLVHLSGMGTQTVIRRMSQMEAFRKEGINALTFGQEALNSKGEWIAKWGGEANGVLSFVASDYLNEAIGLKEPPPDGVGFGLRLLHAVGTQFQMKSAHQLLNHLDKNSAKLEQKIQITYHVQKLKSEIERIRPEISKIFEGTDASSEYIDQLASFHAQIGVSKSGKVQSSDLSEQLKKDYLKKIEILERYGISSKSPEGKELLLSWLTASPKECQDYVNSLWKALRSGYSWIRYGGSFSPDTAILRKWILEGRKPNSLPTRDFDRKVQGFINDLEIEEKSDRALHSLLTDAILLSLDSKTDLMKHAERSLPLFSQFLELETKRLEGYFGPKSEWSPSLRKGLIQEHLKNILRQFCNDQELEQSPHSEEELRSLFQKNSESEFKKMSSLVDEIDRFAHVIDTSNQSTASIRKALIEDFYSASREKEISFGDYIRERFKDSFQINQSTEEIIPVSNKSAVLLDKSRSRRVVQSLFVQSFSIPPVTDTHEPVSVPLKINQRDFSNDYSELVLSWRGEGEKGARASVYIPKNPGEDSPLISLYALRVDRDTWSPEAKEAFDTGLKYESSRSVESAGRFINHVYSFGPRYVPEWKEATPNDPGVVEIFRTSLQKIEQTTNQKVTSLRLEWNLPIVSIETLFQSELFKEAARLGFNQVQVSRDAHHDRVLIFKRAFSESPALQKASTVPYQVKTSPPIGAAVAFAVVGGAAALALSGEAEAKPAHKKKFIKVNPGHKTKKVSAPKQNRQDTNLVEKSLSQTEGVVQIPAVEPPKPAIDPITGVAIALSLAAMGGAVAKIRDGKKAPKNFPDELRNRNISLHKKGSHFSKNARMITIECKEGEAKSLIETIFSHYQSTHPTDQPTVNTLFDIGKELKSKNGIHTGLVVFHFHNPNSTILFSHENGKLTVSKNEQTNRSDIFSFLEKFIHQDDSELSLRSSDPSLPVIKNEPKASPEASDDIQKPTYPIPVSGPDSREKSLMERIGDTIESTLNRIALFGTKKIKVREDRILFHVSNLEEAHSAVLLIVDVLSSFYPSYRRRNIRFEQDRSGPYTLKINGKYHGLLSLDQKSLFINGLGPEKLSLFQTILSESDSKPLSRQKRDSLIALLGATSALGISGEAEAKHDAKNVHKTGKRSKNNKKVEAKIDAVPANFDATPNPAPKKVEATGTEVGKEIPKPGETKGISAGDVAAGGLLLTLGLAIGELSSRWLRGRGLLSALFSSPPSSSVTNGIPVSRFGKIQKSSSTDLLTYAGAPGGLKILGPGELKVSGGEIDSERTLYGENLSSERERWKALKPGQSVPVKPEETCFQDANGKIYQIVRVKGDYFFEEVKPVGEPVPENHLIHSLSKLEKQGIVASSDLIKGDLDPTHRGEIDPNLVSVKVVESSLSRTSAFSSEGGGEKKTNEDVVLQVTLEYSIQKDGKTVLVKEEFQIDIDGMGGHGQGDKAAALIGEVIERELKKDGDIKRALERANEALLSLSPNDEGERPGAVLVATQLTRFEGIEQKDVLRTYLVGDAKAILFEKQENGEWLPVYRTVDHSYMVDNAGAPGIKNRTLQMSASPASNLVTSALVASTYKVGETGTGEVPLLDKSGKIVNWVPAEHLKNGILLNPNKKYRIAVMSDGVSENGGTRLLTTHMNQNKTATIESITKSIALEVHRRIKSLNGGEKDHRMHEGGNLLEEHPEITKKDFQKATNNKRPKPSYEQYYIGLEYTPFYHQGAVYYWNSEKGKAYRLIDHNKDDNASLRLSELKPFYSPDKLTVYSRSSDRPTVRTATLAGGIVSLAAAASAEAKPAHKKVAGHEKHDAKKVSETAKPSKEKTKKDAKIDAPAADFKGVPPPVKQVQETGTQVGQGAPVPSPEPSSMPGTAGVFWGLAAALGLAALAGGIWHGLKKRGRTSELPPPIQGAKSLIEPVPVRKEVASTTVDSNTTKGSSSINFEDPFLDIGLIREMSERDPAFFKIVKPILDPSLNRANLKDEAVSELLKLSPEKRLQKIIQAFKNKGIETGNLHDVDAEAFRTLVWFFLSVEFVEQKLETLPLNIVRPLMVEGIYINKSIREFAGGRMHNGGYNIAYYRPYVRQRQQDPLLKNIKDYVRERRDKATSPTPALPIPSQNSPSEPLRTGNYRWFNRGTVAMARVLDEQGNEMRVIRLDQEPHSIAQILRSARGFDMRLVKDDGSIEIVAYYPLRPADVEKILNGLKPIQGNSAKPPAPPPPSSSPVPGRPDISLTYQSSRGPKPVRRDEAPPPAPERRAPETVRQVAVPVASLPSPSVTGFTVGAPLVEALTDEILRIMGSPHSGGRVLTNQKTGVKRVESEWTGLELTREVRRGRYIDLPFSPDVKKAQAGLGAFYARYAVDPSASGRKMNVYLKPTDHDFQPVDAEKRKVYITPPYDKAGDFLFKLMDTSQELGVKWLGAKTYFDFDSEQLDGPKPIMKQEQNSVCFYFRNDGEFAKFVRAVELAEQRSGIRLLAYPSEGMKMYGQALGGRVNFGIDLPLYWDGGGGAKDTNYDHWSPRIIEVAHEAYRESQRQGLPPNQVRRKVYEAIDQGLKNARQVGSDHHLALSPETSDFHFNKIYREDGNFLSFNSNWISKETGQKIIFNKKAIQEDLEQALRGSGKISLPYDAQALNALAKTRVKVKKAKDESEGEWQYLLAVQNAYATVAWEMGYEPLKFEIVKEIKGGKEVRKFVSGDLKSRAVTGEKPAAVSSPKSPQVGPREYHPQLEWEGRTEGVRSVESLRSKLTEEDLRLLAQGEKVVKMERGTRFNRASYLVFTPNPGSSEKVSVHAFEGEEVALIFNTQRPSSEWQARANLVPKLADRLEVGKPLALRGLSQSGKTSLGMLVAEAKSKSSVDTFQVKVSFQTMGSKGTANDVALELIDGSSLSLSEHETAELATAYEEGKPALKIFDQLLAKHGKKMVLVLDELAVIESNGNALENLFVQLQELQNIYPIVILHEISNSPRYQRMLARIESHYMAPLTQPETEAYIDRVLRVTVDQSTIPPQVRRTVENYFSLSPREKQQIFELTYGHPLLVNRILEALFDRFPEPAIERSKILDIRFLFEHITDGNVGDPTIENSYGYNYRHRDMLSPEQRDLLQKAAQQGPLRLTADQQILSEPLLKIGWLKKTRDAQYEIAGEILKEFLLRQNSPPR